MQQKLVHIHYDATSVNRRCWMLIFSFMDHHSCKTSLNGHLYCSRNWTLLVEKNRPNSKYRNLLSYNMLTSTKQCMLIGVIRAATNDYTRRKRNQGHVIIFNNNTHNYFNLQSVVSRSGPKRQRIK
jgi:hypothetical protein